MKPGKKSRKKSRKQKPKGILRQLPADHPQSLDNPANEWVWRELARAWGRAWADLEWDRMLKERKPPEREDPT